MSDAQLGDRQCGALPLAPAPDTGEIGLRKVSCGHQGSVPVKGASWGLHATLMGVIKIE